MKIARIDTQSVKVPYTFGGDHKGEGLRTWTTNNILLVRVETDNGIVGWGEAFCYACTDAVRAAVHNMIAPIAIGQDARDIAKLSYELQQKLHQITPSPDHEFQVLRKKKDFDRALPRLVVAASLTEEVR